MMTKLERIALGLILAPATPLVGLLGGWWGAYALLPEKWIPLGAIAGLLAGILVDPFLLKKLLERRPSLLLWGTVFLFYSVGIFGFFMGVPVVNAVLAIPAGFVIGSWLRAENANRPRAWKAAQRTAWFTSGVLAMICVASAFIALTDPYTASGLQHMLGLGFTVTQGMVIGLILAGGAGLLLVCWGLTVAAVWVTYKWLPRKPAAQAGSDGSWG
jgi:hypothetical protein